MVDKSSKPACDFRCNQASELGLECETCPGRNELKPMPGMEPLPRWRYATNSFDFRGYWRARQLGAGNYGVVIRANKLHERTVWIQFERNGDAR